MTSASSSKGTPTSSEGATSTRKKHGPRVRLRKIYNQARKELNRSYRSGMISTATDEGYNSMLSSITSLRNERRRTCELGKTRKALFETLAHLEGTDLKSTQKSYYDVRREDGMLRPEEATQNSELLKAWRDSTADDRMNRWTKNDWDRQTTDLNRECNKSKRKNAILMDDITRLRSLMSDRGENTSTGNTTDAGLSSLEASSADTLKRIRAKQAGWKPPKNPNEVELTDSSLSIELSLQKSETDSLNQSGSAKG